MKLTEIIDGTPIIVHLIQQLIENGEEILIDCLLPSEAGPGIGAPGPGNKVKPERIKGRVFEVHPAREIGTGSTEYSASLLCIEIEYRYQWNSVIPIWADWAEQHLLLSKTENGWKVHR